MKVTVVGSGSWGTALSKVLADAGNDVCLLCRGNDVVDAINADHVNPRYLSDVKLPESICATTDAAVAFEGSEACLFVTPSKYLRETAQKLSNVILEKLYIAICSKGVEADSGMLPVEVLADVLGNESRMAVVSGPTHAEEVIKGIQSGAVVASTNNETAKFFQGILATTYFRTYTSCDVVGVELCAAFKNVIAIAVGISYGLGMGDDTAAMLITRGLAEMGRMVIACDGNPMTCMGLAGAGDMVVTCMSRHSRNRRFGQDYIAKGKTLADFEADTHMVVEGAVACKTLESLSKRHGVELPLTDAIREVVWGGEDPMAVAKELIDRPLKSELYGII